MVRLVIKLVLIMFQQLNETKKWLDEYDNKQGFNFLEMFPENRYMFNEM